MKDEIKEILKLMQEIVDEDKNNQFKNHKLLLDYITNLQESEAYYYGQYKDSKSRNEKAIEKIIKIQEDYEKEHYLVDKLTRQLNDEYKNTEHQCKQKEFKDLILKALHKHFTEHEEYENDEFLKQLESCTVNDIVWLKRMAGDDNG